MTLNWNDSLVHSNNTIWRSLRRVYEEVCVDQRVLSYLWRVDVFKTRSFNESDLKWNIFKVTQCLVPHSTSPTLILYSSAEDAVALQYWLLVSTPRRISSPSTGAPTANISALITISNESGWQVTLMVFTCCGSSAGDFCCCCPSSDLPVFARLWNEASRVGGKAKEELTQSPTRRITWTWKASISETDNRNLVSCSLSSWLTHSRPMVQGERWSFFKL